MVEAMSGRWSSAAVTSAAVTVEAEAAAAAMAATAVTTMAVTVAARATAAAIAAARAMATAVAYDESCCGDGGMSALSVLPLLQTNTMKYQLLSQSHPHLKMFFLFFG